MYAKKLAKHLNFCASLLFQALTGQSYQHFVIVFSSTKTRLNWATRIKEVTKFDNMVSHFDTVLEFFMQLD